MELVEDKENMIFCEDMVLGAESGMGVETDNQLLSKVPLPRGNDLEQPALLPTPL